MNILVVGSSVIDLFLKIKDKSHATISKNTVSFLLGDKIPTSVEKLTLGGNGSNVSVGLTRLGLSTTFFTYLGNDILSKNIEQTIQKEGVSLLAQKSGQSSSLSLIFDFDEDRIIFSHHPLIEHHFELAPTHFDYIYLTAIGSDWEITYQKVSNFAKQNNSILALSPGSYELKDCTNVLYTTLKEAKLLFVNKQEAELILTKAGQTAPNNMEDLLKQLKTLGPTIISITDGEKGAYSLSEDGQIFKISSYGGKAVEKTGAGDAYATGFLASYLHKNKIEECMRWGSFNAFSVMGKIGAQDGLLKTEGMNRLLQEHKELQAEKLT